VICDLFNEPTPDALYASKWAGWRNGRVGSDGVTYIGFQSMVTQLRHYGLTNTFWVEGCGHSSTLAGIHGSAGNHQLTDPLNKIVYSIHHPQGRHTPTNWNQQFGYLVGLGIPVVVGEWTNYASTKAECWAQARTDVPAFLDFLTSLRVCGLVVWSLTKDVLVVDQKSWQPTRILPTYKCDGSVTGQGAGQLIQDRFKEWSQAESGTATGSGATLR
jgi:hypothetical protein